MSTAAKVTIALWVILVLVILFMSNGTVFDFPNVLDLIRPISREASVTLDRNWLITVLSVLTAGSGLFVALFRNDDSSGKTWAFAAIGTVLGYWLCRYTF
jgi:hypothetical protein